MNLLSALCLIAALPSLAHAAGTMNILDFAPQGTTVDRSGNADASAALAAAITAANKITARGEPACVFIPSGIYRIAKAPPQFVRAGCVKGEGPTQTILKLDPSFDGDLFSWSEAWYPTTPGPTVVGLKILGTRNTTRLQNAIVFYDRNDQAYIENVDIEKLHGRAIYAGVKKTQPQAYLRESRFQSLRLFEDGAQDVPVLELASEGTGNTDATNEIRMMEVDIYGAYGPSFVLRNNGEGNMGNLVIDSLRIEGWEAGNTPADLLVIGDPFMRGKVDNIRFSNLVLIDPQRGYAAFKIQSPTTDTQPYKIVADGFISGGNPLGAGLYIASGRSSSFRFSVLHTLDTNVIVGPYASEIILDGGGDEKHWTYKIDRTSAQGIFFPQYQFARPGLPAN